LGLGVHIPTSMRTWLPLVRFGGIALALGLFASAATTAAGMTSIYDVAPADVFAARGVDHAADAGVPSSSALNEDARRRQRAREAAVTTILGHNPFCDDCPDPVADAAPGATPSPVVASAAAPSVQVLATMESFDPTRSLATIYHPERGTWVASIGESLEPGVLVASIGPGQLTYARGTATGVLRVGEVARVEPARTPTRPKPPKGEGATQADPMSEKVNCEPGKRCTIERSLIQDVMANPAALGGMRAYPSDGGFKIAGVRAGTLVHELGLRNGDILTGVGGKPLATIDDALSLLPLLRSASNVEVTFSRRGKPITHEIEIV